MGKIIFVASCLSLFIAIFLISLANLKNSEIFAHSISNKTVIHMTKDGFNPQNVEVNQKQAVVFENEDRLDHWPASNIHPTHGIYPEFDPQKPIAPKKSWEFTFDKLGEWRFHDHLYPQFTGTIKVVEGIAKPTQSKFSFTDIFSNLKNFFAKIFSFAPVKSQDKNLSKEFKSPQVVDEKNLYKNLNFTCSQSNYSCTTDFLKETTAKYGPETATKILEMLQTDQKISKSIDDHQLAHEIGRQTSEIFGTNAQSFLLCPMNAYNGGCQHGFFENALGKTESAKEAANLICGSLDENFSSKFKFYCYHGIGHGIMMAKAYDLTASLSTCNTLEDSYSQQGCWQGVFMENVNGGLKGQARDGVFSESDTLAPCDKVDEQYRHECFINHSAWLMRASSNNIAQAAKKCLDAPAPHVSACFQTLGLLTSNPSWQQSILGRNDPPDQVQIALELCYQFPKKSQNDCFIGGLDNIANNDEITNLEKRALKFCQDTAWNKAECYTQIGINIARQVVNLDERKSLCQKIDPEYQQNCEAAAAI